MLIDKRIIWVFSILFGLCVFDVNRNIIKVVVWRELRFRGYDMIFCGKILINGF